MTRRTTTDDAQSLRAFLTMVERDFPEELLRIRVPVRRELDVTSLVFELERAGKSPVVIYENVEGSKMPIVTNIAGSVTSDVVALKVIVTNGVLFMDDFDSFSTPIIVTNTGSTNGYKIVYRSISSRLDFKAIFGFDYSIVNFPKSIPPAPNSANGITKGLFLTVNKDTTAGAAAVNLYPTNQFFNGDFSLKFDMWINWANINTSTEHTLFAHIVFR